MLQRLASAILLLSLMPAVRGHARQASTQTGGDAAAPSLPSARDLAARGRLDQALVELNQLAAQSPEPPGVERLRGIIFYQRDRFQDAIAAFAKAAAQDPGDRESIEMRGVSLFRTGHAAEAIVYLEKARASVQQANIDPNYVLAVCYAEVRRYDDSRHAFAAQYGFAPDSAEAYLLAGRMFLRRELRDEAAAQAAKALELNPALPLAHELLGEIALARGDLPGAIRELEAERKVNPLDPELYDRLGDAYLRTGQYTQAEQSLNRAVVLEPDSTGPYILLGETFLKLNDPIQAIQYLFHAGQMDPGNYMTHYLLAQAYRATGQVDEANREFRMVVDLQKNGLRAAPER
ncbi:MAG TPA: tetratricopeptide repeat protein [Terracidiphilus sp.]|nr:tetratricopeptide repeat protein [Terracidiphilus sp.]